MYDEFGSSANYILPPNGGAFADPWAYSGTDNTAMQDLAGYGEPPSPPPTEYWEGLPTVENSGVTSSPAGTGGAADWLQQLYSRFIGPGTTLGGKEGMFSNVGAQGQGAASPLMSLASGAYGMYLANKQRQTAQRAIAGSAPWTTSGGTAMAGEQLKGVIAGDFTNDAGFRAAQQSAARASSQQPGGFAASAAAQAALKYQNDRIQTLGAPAGVGFSPATGYQTALSGANSANQLASQSLGSIGYGATGANAGTQMPPWLQQYLIQNGMARPQP